MFFREPRTPSAKTPGRRNTTDNAGGARSSFAPGTASGALSRRSSIFQSTGGSSAVFKDKRQLLLMTTRNANITQIFNFLNGEVSIEEVRSPTRKNFLFMFEYVYCTFNDNYCLPKSPDEQNAEIIRIFKTMGYPVIMKNSTLQSVNAPTSWPHMLGALSWMIDLAEFFNSVKLEEEFSKEGDASKSSVLQYSADVEICKEYFHLRPERSAEIDKGLAHELALKHIPVYSIHLKAALDFESRLEEAELRLSQLAEEMSALDLEQQIDLCAKLQEELKALDSDVQNLEGYVEQVKKEEERLMVLLETHKKSLDKVEAKIEAVKEIIAEKEFKIEEQTKRTGLDSDAIRALAMEKEALLEQIKEHTQELEKLSKLRYNLAPKANVAFAQERERYRLLLQKLYDIRAAYLEDMSRPLLETLPSNIKGLLESLVSDVRRLFSRTKTELDSKLHDVEASIRLLSSDERRMHEEEERVEKEKLMEDRELEKEERQREMERDGWQEELMQREKEKRSMEMERETLAEARKEVGDIQRKIKDAEVDLGDTRRKCERKKADVELKLEARYFDLMEQGEQLVNCQRRIEDEVNVLHQFNRMRAENQFT